MRTLPSGTVTFAFTDVEGSTTMLQRLGTDAFLEVLERHNQLVRDAFAAGVEVRSEGDAFFYVFGSAGDALTAAVDVQRRIARYPWPTDGTIRVRIGLHTGDGRLGGDDYVGLDVHRAARIAAAGHGGQVLLSEATRVLGSSAVEPDVALRDLGVHRFKDLDRPERIHQAVIPGLDSDHPPIRSLNTRPNNLPAQPSDFIGRAAEAAAVADLLERSRLVTLTGPGGRGKTRLAIHVASQVLGRFDDGVVYVALDALRDPDLVADAIVSTLGRDHEAERPAVATAAGHLADKTVLLVLDNFEQVLPAASDVAALLAAAPRLRILITSQAVLRIAGEHVYPVPPLAPDEAIELFVHRARAADPEFHLDDTDRAAVARLADRLESSPLAMELAAARVRLLGLEALVDRMTQRLDVGGGSRDAPARHRTLQAAIAWSYDLLDEEEQAGLGRLSVFEGGFTLDAVEAVAGPDADVVVASLLDKSLLRGTVTRGQARFSMLDSIRRFSLDRLEESGEHPGTAARHAQYFARLAATARPLLEGPTEQAWLDRLADEHENIRAVLRRSIDLGEPDDGLRTAGCAWRYFHRRGHLPEARDWLTRLLDLPGASAAARAEGLDGLAGIVYWQADYEASLRLYGEVLDLFTTLDQAERVADTLFALSTTSLLIGDFERGSEYGRRARSAYEEAGIVEGMRRVVTTEAFHAWRTGQLPEALELMTEAHDLYTQAGDTGEQRQSEIALATILHQVGRQAEAIELSGTVLEAMVDAADVAGTIQAIEYLSVILEDDSPEQAVRLAAAAAKLRSDLGGGMTIDVVGLTPARDSAAQKLTADEIEALWNEGEAMDLDTATAYARMVTAPS